MTSNISYCCFEWQHEKCIQKHPLGLWQLCMAICLARAKAGPVCSVLHTVRLRVRSTVTKGTLILRQLSQTEKKTSHSSHLTNAAVLYLQLWRNFNEIFKQGMQHTPVAHSQIYHTSFPQFYHTTVFQRMEYTVIILSVHLLTAVNMAERITTLFHNLTAKLHHITDLGKILAEPEIQGRQIGNFLFCYISQTSQVWNRMWMESQYEVMPDLLDDYSVDDSEWPLKVISTTEPLQGRYLWNIHTELNITCSHII